MLKKQLRLAPGIFCLMFFLFSGNIFAKGSENQLFFASDPSLSPDGKTIVFAYEDDLWTVAAEGGKAQRITGMAGRESNPRYSPDGKWIAFTGRQDGNANVYVMPVDGGDIRQLTFHDGSSSAESWSWDSKYIYFTSDAYNLMSTYKIALSGGTPQRLFPHYFNWPHSLVENPKTGEYYFTDSWESSRFANRKRYKGEFNPDIKSWNPKTSEYKVHTTYNGKDLWPTIDKEGNIYYVSDEVNNEYNLYALKNDKPEALTSFTTSIKQPQVDANGDRIVFEKDYQVYLFETATGKSMPVSIQLPSNNTLNIAEGFNVKGKITAFDLSADDKKLAFVSRGELFVSDAEGKFIKHLKIEGQGRVIEVKWLWDNETLIYSKTVDGWPNWFKTAANGIGKEEQLTHDQQSDRNLTLDKKRSFGVYLSGRDELKKIDLKSGKSETLLKDEFWGIENTKPQISPDGKYVAYTAKRNFEDDIFLYHFTDKKIVNLTNTGVSETEPAWSPDGKYIYFTTDREKPSYPYGFESSRIYRIALDHYSSDFKEDRFDALFTKSAKVDTANATPDPVNMDNMAERWEQVSVQSGNHSASFITLKKDETRVFYYSASDHDGANGIMRWSKKTFDKADTKKVDGGDAGEAEYAEGKSKYYVLAGGTLFELDGDAPKLKKIDLDYSFTRNLATEFREMFEETWANLDENYYDDKFHGIDWEKTRKRYEDFLPYVKNRSNIRILLNDMLGELNSSHMGFYTSGDEEKTFFGSKTLATGILFDENAPYKVVSVVHNSPADNKTTSIQPGDVLIAVNGTQVDDSKNRDLYFSSPSMSESMDLTFKRGGQTINLRLHPESSAMLKGQIYDQWIAENQKTVDDKTNKRIAYIQMKDMGQESLNKFMIEIANEAYNRDGLILDLRYNVGGNVHDQVLDILSRRPYLQWKYRDGKITTQPNFFPSGKPIVLLINEQTLSDGEMTAAGFQQLGLGKIVGTETYRWIIFTSAKSMVDGSMCRMPSWGCYKLNGDDIEKTGVTPDIVVKNTIKDRMNNSDPQLDMAIQKIMKDLK
jgi:tricorn protease